MPDQIQKSETTNAVLKEKIEGLTKLTDERFSTIKDSLLRIERNSDGFATKTELDDVKSEFNKLVSEIKDTFIQHSLDDKTSFGELNVGQRELRDTIKTWVGGLAIIAIILPIIVPIMMHYLFNLD